MITSHNSGNTAAVVHIDMAEFDTLGPFPSYVGSYDNLREVAKAAAVDALIRSGWEGARVTKAALTLGGSAFQVNVRRVTGTK